MAYAYNKQEHAFKRIEKDIKSDRIPNVVLLCGPENYLVKFYENRLSSIYTNDAVKALDLSVITGDSLNADNIIENCETLSLMSPRKVVIVPDFLPADGKGLRGFPDSEVGKVIAYLKDVPESSLLLFTSGEPEAGKKNNKFRQAVEKNGAVYDFQPLDDTLLKGFIEKRLRATGKNYKPSVVRTLMTETGYGNKYVEYTLYNLDNDLRKLAAYAGPEITSEDVKAVITDNPENNVFGLLDAVAQNRKGDALIMAHNLFNAKMSPFLIQSMIVSQLELILYGKELTEQGCSLKEICRLTNNKFEFKVKKALTLSKKYSYAQIRHMLIGAYEVDRNVKTGTFDPEMALEYYISSI